MIDVVVMPSGWFVSIVTGGSVGITSVPPESTARSESTWGPGSQESWTAIESAWWTHGKRVAWIRSKTP